MGTEQKVAVITGASRGIGAALVKAYRDRDYRVVAAARSMKPSNDAGVLIVPGDIAERKTAERAISEGIVPVPTDRFACQQRRHLYHQALHPIYAGRLCGDSWSQRRRILSHHTTRGRRNGKAR